MESVLQPLRAYEHWLAQYKRVWRGRSARPSVRCSICALGGRTLSTRLRTRRRAVPRLRRSRAARRSCHADSTTPVELARDGRDQVDAHLPRDDRDTARERDAFVGASAVRGDAGLGLGRRLPRDHCGFRAVSSWLRLLVVPVAVLLDGVLDADGGVGREVETATFVTIFRFLIVPMFFFHTFSRSHSCRSSSSWSRTSRRSGTASALPDAHARRRQLLAARSATPPTCSWTSWARPRAVRIGGRCSDSAFACVSTGPGPRRLFERNVMSHRRTWAIIVSGFFEPLFYLLAARLQAPEPMSATS